jgi:hypothetical protein
MKETSFGLQEPQIPRTTMDPWSPFTLELPETEHKIVVNPVLCQSFQESLSFLPTPRHWTAGSPGLSSLLLSPILSVKSSKSWGAPEDSLSCPETLSHGSPTSGQQEDKEKGKWCPVCPKGILQCLLQLQADPDPSVQRDETLLFLRELHLVQEDLVQGIACLSPSWG